MGSLLAPVSWGPAEGGQPFALSTGSLKARPGADSLLNDRALELGKAAPLDFSNWTESNGLAQSPAEI